MRRFALHAGVALGLLGLLTACSGSRKREDPMLRLSAEESLVEGRRLFEAKKYGQAHPYFTHAFEVEPNSASGREALLLAADSLFLDGNRSNYVQAESRYRDFQNRFPTSERASYVQLQIGRSLVERMERADRDQKVTRQAQEALEELLRTYPATPEAEQAQPYLNQVRDRLAEHEYLVGNFYLRFGLPGSAILRFETVLRQHPEYSKMDQLLYELARAQVDAKKADDAGRTIARLREEFPQSEWARKAEKLKG